MLTTDSGPLRYDYDFGDSWEHQIELIEVIEGLPQVPVVIQGERHGPLEDSCGVHGYASLVEILADPTHRGHQDIAYVGSSDGRSLGR